MAADLRVGPCHIYLGNPTIANGTGMVYLGATRGDVRVSPNVNVSTGRADQYGSAPLATAVYTGGPRPVAIAPLVDEEKAKLVHQIIGSELITANGETALAFGTSFKAIPLSEIKTLALVPVTEMDQGVNGVDAKHAIWFPAAVSNAFGDIVFNLPEGDDALQPHELQLVSLYREKDQANNVIPPAARVGWIGAPKALGLTWYLPAPIP